MLVILHLLQSSITLVSPEYTDHIRLAAPTLTKKCSENDTRHSLDSISKVVDILLDCIRVSGALDALNVSSQGVVKSVSHLLLAASK